MKHALLAASVVALLSVDDVAAEQRSYAHTVIGMSEDTAMTLSGVFSEEEKLNNHPCGPLNNKGNMNNAYCHAQVSAFIYEYMLSKDVPSAAAHAAALGFWLLKEYAIDLNPSMDDIYTAPVTLYSSKKYDRTVKVQCNFAMECFFTFNHQW